MNEKEKRDFYIANCKCCLLAEAMKDCPMCKFNIGLAEKVNTVSKEKEGTKIFPVYYPATR